MAKTDAELGPVESELALGTAEVPAVEPSGPGEDQKQNGNGETKTRTSRREEWRKNVKSDMLSQAESSDPHEIRKQVEFYFSDSNLPFDKFLNGQVEGSKNKAVPLTTIHSFKRMRHFQPYSAVLGALRDSDVLEVTDAEEVRRKVALPRPDAGAVAERDAVKEFEGKALPRSVYAKGFGDETSTTQFDIEAFFAPYGPINAIRLRRTYPDRIFKGSVFVEFDDDRTQTAFLALDPKPKFLGRDLLVLSKKQYYDSKAAAARPSRDKTRGGRQRGGRAGKTAGRGRQDAGAKDWKKSREEFQKDQPADPSHRDAGGDEAGNSSPKADALRHAATGGAQSATAAENGNDSPVVAEPRTALMQDAESGTGVASEASADTSKKRERDGADEDTSSKKQRMAAEDVAKVV